MKQYQPPLGTCKKCTFLDPDLVIYNSGDRGQPICVTNPNKTVAHTKVWKSGVGQSTSTEPVLFLEIGSLTTMPRCSQDGDVVRKRNTASMLEMKTSPGHSSSLQGLILNNSLKLIHYGGEKLLYPFLDTVVFLNLELIVNSNIYLG